MQFLDLNGGSTAYCFKRCYSALKSDVDQQFRANLTQVRSTHVLTRLIYKRERKRELLLCSSLPPPKPWVSHKIKNLGVWT